MPALVLPLTSHRSGEWLLFHSAGRGSWGMKEGLCRHALQSLDGVRNNALMRINVREELNFTFKAFMSDYSLSMVYHKKVMRVFLTNPLAFRVTARHSWDDTNNHMLTLTAFSHLCKKAYHGHHHAMEVLVQSLLDLDVRDSQGRTLWTCLP
ncbi:uncharacterized protein ACWYII_012076 [Salvelinus alpinus]